MIKTARLPPATPTPSWPRYASFAACVYIISMPLAFAFPFRSGSRSWSLWTAPIEGALTNRLYEMENNEPSVAQTTMGKGKMLRTENNEICNVMSQHYLL